MAWRMSRGCIARVLQAGLVLCVAGLVLSSGLGCDGDFEKQSKLSGLRVLAVQADNPYPKPGDTVKLNMLWHDGKAEDPDPPRDVQILWIGGCYNPQGDLYYGCYPKLAEVFGQAESNPETLQLLGSGSSFSLKIPEDIISRRPVKEDVEPYGLSYVFFAACAGQVRPITSADEGIPLACFDSDGQRLGSDDFVPGYLSLYSYTGRTNQNPLLLGLSVNGQAGGETDEVSIPVCASGSCPEYEIKTLVDPASAEIDPGAVDPDGNQLSEQLWVSYYASDGGLDRGARLVNDAVKGWNDDCGVKFTPPREAKKVVVYGIVHDNRGGAAWAKRTIRVE